MLPPPIKLVLGGFEPGHQPDGNSVLIDGDTAVAIVDTGRHRLHTERALKAARGGKPVIAVINTQWHLDHVSNNPAIKAAHPHAKVYASRAIDDALTGGKLDPVTVEEIKGDLATFDKGEQLKPDVAVDGVRTLKVGRPMLQLRLARDAATASDVWIYDPKARCDRGRPCDLCRAVSRYRVPGGVAQGDGPSPRHRPARSSPAMARR